MGLVVDVSKWETRLLRRKDWRDGRCEVLPAVIEEVGQFKRIACLGCERCGVCDRQLLIREAVAHMETEEAIAFRHVSTKRPAVDLAATTPAADRVITLNTVSAFGVVYGREQPGTRR